MYRSFCVIVLLLVALSSVSGQETPLHELPPAQRLAIVMQLMDNRIGASALGDDTVALRDVSALENGSALSVNLINGG